MERNRKNLRLEGLETLKFDGFDLGQGGFLLWRVLIDEGD
jgi:hypothetical protein